MDLVKGQMAPKNQGHGERSRKRTLAKEYSKVLPTAIRTRQTGLCGLSNECLNSVTPGCSAGDPGDSAEDTALRASRRLQSSDCRLLLGEGLFRGE